MPIITPGSGGGGGGGAISGVTVTGTAASGQAPIASSSSAGTWAYPPGFEIGYTQFTASVPILSTTEATGTAIVSAGALTFDGTPVLCQFFTANLTSPGSSAGDFSVVSLFEGATQIGRLGTLLTSGSHTEFAPMFGQYRFTPTVGSHTYSITAFANSTTGAPTVGSGVAGTGNSVPSYVRFVKV